MSSAAQAILDHRYQLDRRHKRTPSPSPSPSPVDRFGRFGLASSPSGIRGASAFQMPTAEQVRAYNIEGALQGLRGASVAPTPAAGPYPWWA